METQFIAFGIMINGVVQGVGMRPAVARMAESYSLTGFIKNNLYGVDIHVEGKCKDLDDFRQSFLSGLPPASQITSIQWTLATPQKFDKFTVYEEFDPGPKSNGLKIVKQPLATRIPPDQVTCSQCNAELANPGKRRFGYPFTSCVDCGPRFSIIREMPFERSNTSMLSFSLCNDCQKENQTLSDRRSHCQTNACKSCGPKVWLRNSGNETLAAGGQSLILASEALKEGKIIALRGLGGYQLLADATSETVVLELRKRKNRDSKPFAVLVGSVDEACRLAYLNLSEKQQLQSPAGPILILSRRHRNLLAPSISGSLNTVGLILPTTPLHAKLCELTGMPLVCTSANVSGQPLVYRYEDALDQLQDMADFWLDHDRPIERPLDDSVVRVLADKPATFRLGRGLAPLTLPISSTISITAYGGHQKTAIAVSNGVQSFLGPHIGDLETVDMRDRYDQQLDALEKLYRSTPTSLACDQHPEYHSTRRAMERSRDNSAPAVQIQHHHAHIVAGMLGNKLLGKKVLGVAFDGTGYATDGTIWGGEFMTATVDSFDRIGSLLPFRMVGGERAIRQPWRLAVSIVLDTLADERVGIKCLQRLGFDTDGIHKVSNAWKKPALHQATSSVGRLFDAVAAIILGITHCNHEGEAAMILESTCDLDEESAYTFSVQEKEILHLNWKPMIKELLQDCENRMAPEKTAMRFHRGLANGVVEICRRFPHLPVVLGGGVFQNRILVELINDGLGSFGQQLGLPGDIPVNDAGLAAGQLAVAACQSHQK